MERPSPVAIYRLRGDFDGSEKLITLGLGEHRVGYSRHADVILPVSGVSRRHAVLVATRQQLLVEDLDSTNGTRVDGVSVRRGQVPVGVELRFGPVRLRVEAAADDESKLAIELGCSGTAGAELSIPDDSTLVVAGDPSSPSSPAQGLFFPAGYCAGMSPPMQALYQRLKPHSRGSLPVLIHGETGTGKERIARILHCSSERRAGPFVAINCAAIPDDLLEAEMFGIERGVATGVEPRLGRFQLAEGGTLFLDEIGEMPPPLQAKLLRALQEREVQPVGASQPRPFDVRVVAATNVDLEQQRTSGALREDLYYRLAGLVLEVPPLRDCAADIPRLVEHFLRTFVAETGIRVRGLTATALRLLVAYTWPGNIRELEHEVRRLVYISADGEVLTREHLSQRLRRSMATTSSTGSPATAAPDGLARLVAELDSLSLKPLTEALEGCLIREALRRVKGKKIAACHLLSLSRNGLDKKMKRLGITVPSAAVRSEAVP